jgi:integrase/recombinase XerD
MTTAIVASGNDYQIAKASDADELLVSTWLRRSRSEHTRRAYRLDVARFRSFVGKPLARVTLADLQDFAESLEDLSLSSQRRTLSAVKSLLGFGHKSGYLPVNVGIAIQAPRPKNTLAERILSESQVQRMLALETDRRNHAILRLLYGGGLRVAELCQLTWRDLQPRGETGQVTVYGKGDRTRVVLLSRDTWQELAALRGTAGDDDPVFVSRRGGPLAESAVYRIVRKAARRAGLPGSVSPHWLRHAHASHALDRGAPVSLVKETLGHASVATTDRYLHARPDDSSARYLAV